MALGFSSRRFVMISHEDMLALSAMEIADELAAFDRVANPGDHWQGWRDIEALSDSDLRYRLQFARLYLLKRLPSIDNHDDALELAVAQNAGQGPTAILDIVDHWVSQREARSDRQKPDVVGFGSTQSVGYFTGHE
jgi:hypothetical protein